MNRNTPHQSLANLLSNRPANPTVLRRSTSMSSALMHRILAYMDRKHRSPNEYAAFHQKFFWILVVIAVVLVAAIIGAAVGGYMAGKSKG